MSMSPITIGQFNNVPVPYSPLGIHLAVAVPAHAWCFGLRVFHWTSMRGEGEGGGELRRTKAESRVSEKDQGSRYVGLLA